MSGHEPEQGGRQILRQPHEDDWAWRRAVRARPKALAAYRVLVLLLGLLLVVGGLLLVPLPGPGWLIVLLGLAVLASEFEPAARLLDHARARLHRWEEWVRTQPRWVQWGIALGTAACVAGVLWVTLRISGVPMWLPDALENPLVEHAGLPRRDG